MNKEKTRKLPDHYPAYTVEQGGTPQSHGLAEPTKWDSPAGESQINEMFDLVPRHGDEEWPKRVIDILWKWLDPTTKKVLGDAYTGGNLFDEQYRIFKAMKELGFPGWASVCKFVEYDKCVEFFTRALKWIDNLGLKPKKDRDFLKGGGFGVYDRYIQRCLRSGKKSFEAKKYFAQDRLSVYLFKAKGIDITKVCGYVHPGHNTYNAFHATKFYEVVDLVQDSYEGVTPLIRAFFMLGAHVGSMGRCGVLVHKPEDCPAGGYIAGLPEFKFMEESNFLEVILMPWEKDRQDNKAKKSEAPRSAYDETTMKAIKHLQSISCEELSDDQAWKEIQEMNLSYDEVMELTCDDPTDCCKEEK